MKLKHILPCAAVMLSMGFTSCIGDLDVTPIDPSTVMEVDPVGLFNKCYANMALAGQGGANGDCDIDGLDGGTTGFVRQLFNANELTTDEAICCWGDEGIPAFNYNQYDASHPMTRGFYYRLCAGITYCNHYLDPDVAGNYDKTMTAEVRFLRALYYYHLMDCFGNVPFLTELSADNAPQASRKDVYNFIESELLAVREDMLEPAARKSGDETYGRADRNAADLLLARLYLNAEVYAGESQWENAKKYAKLVMDGPHKLNTQGMNGYSAYQMLFMGDNGETSAATEAVLPLLQDGTTTTSWGTTLFLLASTTKADMGVFGTSEYWAGNRCRPEFVEKFLGEGNAAAAEGLETKEILAAAGDDRALLFGKDRTASVETPGEFTSGISCAKYSNNYASGGTPHNSKYVDTDFFLMRSAEAYLIFAEADARLSGGQTSAEGTKAVDAIRQRANTNTLGTYSLSFILDELSREFFFEGHRRTDLVRFGQFGGERATYKWQWKGGAKNGVRFDSHLNVFAIPSDDLESNPNLTQNAGY